MIDQSKTRQELIQELTSLRRRISELEQSESDCKQAEEALQENESKYQVAFELCSDAIFWADIDTGIIIDCNRAAESMIELPRDKIIGQQQTMLHPPELKEFYRGYFKRHSERGSIEESEAEVISKSGKRIPVLISATRLKLGNREVLHGIFHDRTEIKKTEEVIRKSEQWFRAIADYTPDWENWVGPNGKVVWVNPSVADFTGYSVDECLHMDDYPAPIAHEDDRERMIRIFNSCVQGSTGKNIEFRIRCKDGTIKWAEVCWQPICDENGYNMGHRASIRNITERKLIAEALHASENKYRTIVENTNDGIYIHDFEGNILDVNDNACRMVGYAREELVGANLAQIDREWRREDLSEANFTEISDKQPAAVHEHLERLLCDENAVFERENVCKDGSVVPVEVSVKIISREGKGLAQGFVRDITRRKRMEEDLKMSEKKYRDIFTEVPIGLFQSSPEGRYLSANNHLAKIMGYDSPEDLIQSITDIGTQVYANPERRDDAMRLLRDNGFFDNFEVQCRSKDGHFVWASLNVRVVRDAKGNIIYFEGSSHDITERKLLEEALRDSEERWKFALEGASDGVWDWYYQTNKVFFSPQWKSMLGYREEDIGDSLDEWDRRVHPDDKKRCYEDLERHFDGRTDIYANEHRILCKDGSYKWILARGKVIRRAEDGKPVRVIGTHTDLTDRKRADEELERHRKHLENMVQERTTEVETKNMTLQELNTTLKVLLRQREEDKKDMEERFVMNVRNLVLPYVEQMKKGALDVGQQAYLGIIETHLHAIASPLLKNMRHFNLTPKEIKVAALVRQDKSTKEIAEILGLATGSIDIHRKNIRKKLGLSDRKSNLRSYIENLEQ